MSFFEQLQWWKTFVTPDRYSYDQMPDQIGKVAIVTGANTGLGYHRRRSGRPWRPCHFRLLKQGESPCCDRQGEEGDQRDIPTHSPSRTETGVPGAGSERYDKVQTISRRILELGSSLASPSQELGGGLPL